MHKSKILAPFVVALTLSVFAADAPKPPVEAEASITPTELHMNLDFLASKELGGRYTLSPSFPITARFLASRLMGYGYKPAGDDGSYFQHFEVISAKAKPEQSKLTITSGGSSKDFEYGKFFMSGVNEANVDADVVFVGYGISSPELKRDDYAGLDVKGKIVLIASGVPKGMDASRIPDNESGVEAAKAHGAIAALKLPAQYYLRGMRSQRFIDYLMHRDSVKLAKEVDGEIPNVTLGPDAAEALLTAINTKLDDIYSGNFKPQGAGAKAKLVLAIERQRETSQNVVGILPGSDAKLHDQYVAFSAHYDHLKTNAKGEIYPGADDDGSGTTSVLAIAKAMAEHPPRRSVLIIFHAGEELGLLGSEYNGDYAPVVPLDKMVVDLNIDMIGRSKLPGDAEKDDEHLTNADTIYVVGSDRISKELDDISKQVNKQGAKLDLDYYYDDPNNPERIYFRSDHWNYAKHGVPIIFYFDGTSVDYHQPTDTIDKIDFNKMARVARLVYQTGWRVANLDEPLRHDAAPAAK